MLPIIIAAWRMLPKYLVRVPAIMGNTRAMRRDDERLLWAEAFGWIDRTGGVAPTTETLFCIASRSKVIAAMILVDRGVIELDAPGPLRDCWRGRRWRLPAFVWRAGHHDHPEGATVSEIGLTDKPLY